jgi:glycosyltransferase involved in cell wall biosynthesis
MVYSSLASIMDSSPPVPRSDASSSRPNLLSESDPLHEPHQPSPPSTSVSFVIPVLNEQESLEKLHTEICRVCQAAAIEAQVVFVDDGSTDDSWGVIKHLAEGHEMTQGIRFRRNFGKAAALSAGFAACSGKFVITMDADLQDDPDEIPRFLEKLNDSVDVVSGWKRVRHDPWHKVLPSRVFNWLVSTLTGVRLHDHNCGFKAYRGQIVKEVNLYGERHRFIPVLAAARGWKVGEIEVQHHARQFGHSKYGLSRLLKGFLDLMTIYLLTGFSARPLHLIGAAGMLCFTLGGIGITYLSAMWVITRLSDRLVVLDLHKTAIFYYCILALLLGAQFLLAGLLAELIVSRTYTAKDSYSVAERSGDLNRTSAGGDDEN